MRDNLISGKPSTFVGSIFLLIGDIHIGRLVGMAISCLRILGLCINDSSLVQVVLVHIFCTHVHSFPLGHLPCRLGLKGMDHLYVCFMSHLRFSCEEKCIFYDTAHRN